jgi:hypothetical protein
MLFKLWVKAFYNLTCALVYLFFSMIEEISITYMLISYLKGLGHKIDFKTSEKN